MVVELMRSGEDEEEILRTVQIIRDLQVTGGNARALFQRRVLLAEDVRLIRKEIEAGVSLPVIAERFSVGVCTVRDIRLGRTYKRVV